MTHPDFRTPEAARAWNRALATEAARKRLLGPFTAAWPIHGATPDDELATSYCFIERGSK